jgi:hypothetical protein
MQRCPLVSERLTFLNPTVMRRALTEPIRVPVGAKA